MIVEFVSWRIYHKIIDPVSVFYSASFFSIRSSSLLRKKLRMVRIMTIPPRIPILSSVGANTVSSISAATRNSKPRRRYVQSLYRTVSISIWCVLCPISNARYILSAFNTPMSIMITPSVHTMKPQVLSISDMRSSVSIIEIYYCNVFSIAFRCSSINLAAFLASKIALLFSAASSGTLSDVAVFNTLLVIHHVFSVGTCIAPSAIFTSPETTICDHILPFMILMALSIVFVASAVTKSHPNIAMIQTEIFAILTHPSTMIRTTFMMVGSWFLSSFFLSSREYIVSGYIIGILVSRKSPGCVV